MTLWNKWMSLVNELSTCCSRKRTFFWLTLALIGFTTQSDFFGVTSLARGAGLIPNYYTCLVNFFYSTGVNLALLRTEWVQLIFRHFNGIVRVNGRCILVGDGIKVAKEGKKMPGVKWLHQSSDSNSKAEFIMGHSIQVVAVIVAGLSSFFAVPMAGEIHEGLPFNCKDTRTQLDKIMEMLIHLQSPELFYFVADKYYCSGRLMKQLIAQGIHVVTMMKRNAVAYLPLEEPTKRGRGRPRKYGHLIKLFSLFDGGDLTFKKASMPNQPHLTIEYAVKKLLWKPLGGLVQFVFVRHPTKGLSIVMSTDLTLDPLDLILCYSLRFKIEVLFKQAIHQVGTFMYRFWLKVMAPTKRGEGDRQLQFAPQSFKEKIENKVGAYHLFIQLGCIAQGLIQYLSIHYHQVVWKQFGSWLRTIRPNVLPSEKVVKTALQKTYVDFLLARTNDPIFEKFLGKRLDISSLGAASFAEKEAA